MDEEELEQIMRSVREVRGPGDPDMEFTLAEASGEPDMVFSEEEAADIQRGPIRPPPVPRVPRPMARAEGAGGLAAPRPSIPPVDESTADVAAPVNPREEFLRRHAEASRNDRKQGAFSDMMRSLAGMLAGNVQLGQQAVPGPSGSAVQDLERQQAISQQADAAEQSARSRQQQMDLAGRRQELAETREGRAASMDELRSGLMRQELDTANMTAEERARMSDPNSAESQTMRRTIMARINGIESGQGILGPEAAVDLRELKDALAGMSASQMDSPHINETLAYYEDLAKGRQVRPRGVRGNVGGPASRVASQRTDVLSRLLQAEARGEQPAADLIAEAATHLSGRRADQVLGSVLSGMDVGGRHQDRRIGDVAMDLEKIEPVTRELAALQQALNTADDGDLRYMLAARGAPAVASSPEVQQLRRRWQTVQNRIIHEMFGAALTEHEAERANAAFGEMRTGDPGVARAAVAELVRIIQGRRALIRSQLSEAGLGQLEQRLQRERTGSPGGGSGAAGRPSRIDPNQPMPFRVNGETVSLTPRQALQRRRSGATVEPVR